MNLVWQHHSWLLSVIRYTPRYQFNVTYLLFLCLCTAQSFVNTSYTSLIRIHQRDRSWCGTWCWRRQLSHLLHCCQCIYLSSILFHCWRPTHLSSTLRKHLIRALARTDCGLIATSKEGGMAFKICMEPIWARRILHCQILCLYQYRCILYLVSSIFYNVSSS